MTIQSGDHFELSVLREGSITPDSASDLPASESAPPGDDSDAQFWHRAHGLETRFQEGLTQGDVRVATNALLEFDRIVWQAQHGLENEAVVAQARDILRDMIVLLGNQLAASPGMGKERLAPLVEALLGLRQKLRVEKQWDAADILRDALDAVDIVVEDTPDGHRWYLRTG